MNSKQESLNLVFLRIWDLKTKKTDFNAKSSALLL